MSLQQQVQMPFSSVDMLRQLLVAIYRYSVCSGLVPEKLDVHTIVALS